ncbi:AsnC family protein [Amycolatopsis marina]|uniref:AsnC family protein n=1 Tax=Amycolatopsis marina TaxID=490629 RepID=UPI000B80EEF3|nr:AsnC family protein [Amycolatopsis marina]
MPVTDPADARLLAALAELGKAAVHELAARVGMDPREAAHRLVSLSASGLPLLVGVESDPQGLRAALAGGAAGPQVGQPQPSQQPPHGAPSGPYPVQGTPSGQYQVAPAYGTPSGAHRPPFPPPSTAPNTPPPATPQSRPFSAPAAPPPPPPDPVLNTWGPPQTASWARGDQPPAGAPATAPAASGKPGDVLETRGLDGEQLAVQLLEVQDPADYLFGAAGYRLDQGERAVVVHTEITNRGNVPFASLPDNYLELLTADGRAITKAPVSLTSRPPHRIGVRPGETTGGHTVYVLPDSTHVTAVRWSPRPEPDERSLTWSVES